MKSGPTRGATETPNEWRASPKLAAVVRLVAFLAPIGIAALAIRLMSPWLYRPAGIAGLFIWIAQATIIGAIVSRTVGLGTRRLLPLATLLTTTLVFPDRAPSRFGVALRAGTIRQLRRRAEELGRSGLGATEAEAAENAIVLVTALGRHDRLTRGHTERVRAYADLIAEEMGFTAAERERLAWGVLLHDVGKMTVPPEILNKTEKLTDEEWQVLKHHPAAGHEMLEPLAGWLGEWRGAAGEHHERWDGKGYPRALTGDEISRAGRITAVADAYDVITSKRSYKEPMSAEAARRELVRCAGTQFDPAVVRAMLAVSLGSAAFDAGPLAWLSDLSVAQAATAIVPSPATAGLGLAAVTVAAALGLGDDPSSRRTAIAAGLENTSISTTAERPDRTSPDATTPDATTVAPTSTPTSTSSPDDTPPTSPTVPPITTTTDPGIVPPPGVAATTTVPSDPSDRPAATTTTPAPPPTTAPTPTVPGPTTTSPTVVGTTIPLVTTTLPPNVTLPPVTVPPVTIPSVTVPSITIPSITTPGVTVPAVSTPVVTTPAVTIPTVTTPAVTTPPVTLPAPPEVTVPVVTTTLPVLGGFLRQD